MSELAQQQSTGKMEAEVSPATEETLTPAPLLTFPGYQTSPRVDRQSLTPQNILALQRTIGNRAVQRLLKERNTGRVNQTVQRLPPGGGSSLPVKPAVKAVDFGTAKSVIQRFPSYNSFEKGWYKRTTRFKISIFTSSSADYALNAPGVKINDSDRLKKANIITAYQRYDSEHSMDALAELFHSITYWETANQANANQPWYPAAMEYLGELKDQIKVKMQAKVDKKQGSLPNITGLASPFQQKPWSRTNQTSKIKTWGAAQGMPGFLKEVGVTTQYYNTQLRGQTERLDNLYKFYLALQQGKTGEAADSYAKIKDVPGMYLVKPLFITHFAGNIQMDKVFGTDSKSTVGQALTEAEKKAIAVYAGDDFEKLNNQLRTSGEQKQAEFPLEHQDDPAKNAAGIQQYKNDWKAQNTRVKQQTLMENIISGLNKLPKFSGISYRGFRTAPPAYFDVIQPGAMLVDLAFQSASPSLEGVRSYLSTVRGTKEIYMLIHTKTAVNIMGISGLKKEAEVLFRPGTKFQVKGIWQYVKGKIPRNAPPEAQMMLQSLGEKRSEIKDYFSPQLFDQAISGITPKEFEAKHGKILKNLDKKSKTAELSTFEQRMQTLKWNPVKVIEVVEV